MNQYISESLDIGTTINQVNFHDFFLIHFWLKLEFYNVHLIYWKENIYQHKNFVGSWIDFLGIEIYSNPWNILNRKY